MISGRFFAPLLVLLALQVLSPTTAFPFWGFGETEGRSGLNLEQGYDLNTVTTVRGKVVSTNIGERGGPVTILMNQGADTVHVIAGPPWYWSDRGISIKAHDEISVQGAKAQGKDGETYLISRTISNISTGESVTLRSETGRPLWKGGGGSGGGGMGMQWRHGGGMRGR